MRHCGPDGSDRRSPPAGIVLAHGRWRAAKALKDFRAGPRLRRQAPFDTTAAAVPTHGESVIVHHYHAPFRIEVRCPLSSQGMFLGSGGIDFTECEVDLACEFLGNQALHDRGCS